MDPASMDKVARVESVERLSFKKFYSTGELVVYPSQAAPPENDQRETTPISR